jgi:hypothetical protein
VEVGDRVWVQGANRLGRILLTIEDDGQLLYVVLYDDDVEPSVPLPRGKSGPVFGIVCAATILVALE